MKENEKGKIGLKILIVLIILCLSIFIAIIVVKKNSNTENNKTGNETSDQILNENNKISNNEEKNVTDNQTQNTIKNTVENEVKNTSTNKTSNENDNNLVDTSDSKGNTFEVEYEDETYITKNDDEEIVFENQRNLPIIKSEKNQKIATKIQDSLTEISNKRWEELKQTSDEYNFVSPSYKAGVDYMLGTALVRENYITFMANQSGSFGGVSWAATELYTYDTETGNLLDLSDFAVDEDEFTEFLTNKIKEYAKEKFDESSLTDIDSKIKEILETSGNYGLQYGNFSVILPKYSIGIGADGVQVVEISKEDVNSYLKTKYQIKY